MDMPLRSEAMPEPEAALSAEDILLALPDPVLVLDADNRIIYANQGAEELWATSAAQLCRARVDSIVPFGSPLLSLVERVRADGCSLSEHEIDISMPRIGPRLVSVSASPLVGREGVLLLLHENSIASKMDRALLHRGAARMVTSMAAVLAHEVKNPLSGIRGAAQLLDRNLGSADRVLTTLICDESDRICTLVDRMEMFNDKPIERRPVNIHQVLERVRMVAENGFAEGVRIIESYDPSLPPVPGDFDQLVQVFLNLVKNAAEAAPAVGGEIVLSTAFRHGVRLAVPGSAAPVRLPLEVAVQDNGDGVPEEIRSHLFDPFVTTKAGGSGLGLALVAKLVRDHGGVVECVSRPRGTIFRVMLPVHEGDPR
jgi:two-component system nitrogen regulation sensor histidine kinase GlnL